MGWRREEEWLDADVVWFGEGAGVPAVAALVLPPLPRFEPAGLTASRLRREAWKRRRRARATALMVLPAVLAPPALFRGGGVAGAGVLVDDPPSLVLPIDRPIVDDVPTLPVARTPKRARKPAAAPEEPAARIEWRNASSYGLWFGGSLVSGTQLPVEGPDWVTWNPNTDSVPNAPHRLYGNERTIRTIVSVLAAYRAANPKAPPTTS